MTLQALKLVCESACLLAVAGSAIYTAQQISAVERDLHNTQVQVQATIASLNTTIQKVNSSYDAQAQSAIAIEKDVRVEMWHVDRTLTTADTAISTIPNVTRALTETAHSASGVMSEAQTTIKGLQPLESAATVDLQHLTPVEDNLALSAADFDAILKDNAIHQTFVNVQGMTDSGNKMLADAQWKEHQLLHPTPKKGFKAAVGIAIDYIHKLTPPFF